MFYLGVLSTSDFTFFRRATHVFDGVHAAGGSNPLASVKAAVDDKGRVAAEPSRGDLQSLDGASLVGLADGEGAGVGVGGGHVGDKLADLRVRRKTYSDFAS